MSDLAHLVQDLRAETHRVPDDIAQLMRRAAAELERREIPLNDFNPAPAPFPPPADDPAARVSRAIGAPCA